MERLVALKIFVAVADHASFAEAARRMRLSPTNVSRGIAELERELGVTLLRRTTRSVGLTPEGSAYLEHCRHILNALNDADRSLRGDNSEPRGELILTAPVVFGRMHVLPVAAELLRRHPQLKVQLSLIDRIVRLVEEGVDIAIRIGALSDSSLHAIRVAQVRHVLVASPAYLDVRGEPSDVKDLENHDLIVHENFAPNQEWRFAGEGRQVIRCEHRLLTNSAETAIDAALEGIGIARVLSYQVQHHVRQRRLKYLLAEFEPPPVPVNLVFQANRRANPNAAVFISACQDYCKTKSFE